jgi:hypothetical protein
MAQLHFYVPDKFAEEIRRRAEQAHLPVSRYLVKLIKREIGTDWPERYFDGVYGGWKGDPLARESEGKFEKRLEF